MSFNLSVYFNIFNQNKKFQDFANLILNYILLIKKKNVLLLLLCWYNYLNYKFVTQYKFNLYYLNVISPRKIKYNQINVCTHLSFLLSL